MKIKRNTANDVLLITRALINRDVTREAGSRICSEHACAEIQNNCISSNVKKKSLKSIEIY